jgi:hypothetical protein
MPFYKQMFADAGLPVDADGNGLDALARVLVVSGDEATLRTRLTGLLELGLDELLLHPLAVSNEGKARQELLQVVASMG